MPETPQVDQLSDEGDDQPVDTRAQRFSPEQAKQAFVKNLYDTSDDPSTLLQKLKDAVPSVSRQEATGYIDGIAESVIAGGFEALSPRDAARLIGEPYLLAMLFDKLPGMTISADNPWFKRASEKASQLEQLPEEERRMLFRESMQARKEINAILRKWT